MLYIPVKKMIVPHEEVEMAVMDEQVITVELEIVPTVDLVAVVLLQVLTEDHLEGLVDEDQAVKMEDHLVVDQLVLMDFWKQVQMDEVAMMKKLIHTKVLQANHLYWVQLMQIK